ncbi:hypothetical protein [Xanthomonas sp. XNM01]|jgi:hypothetical protein|uniref:hypothetical protein n=1 Tax=Xanthomonas sp. XNM01 TaxID=2769289 RepID=UPI00177E37B0|nr:hypothetical protein [Xanthomonas sp. XNM01]MBD9368505.1 hypothetical protein [Xanthomonas sp. XNM01]
MSSRKSTQRSSAASKAVGVLTSDQINRDLAAFRKAGGRIEVLGNTRVLTRVDEPAKKGGKGGA